VKTDNHYPSSRDHVWPKRKAIVASLVIHGLFAVGILTIPGQLLKIKPKPKQIDIVFFPKDERPKAPPPIVEPPPEPPVEVAKVEPPKPEPKKVMEPPKPKPEPEPQRVAKADPPKPRPKVVEPPKPKPKPKRPVRTGMLGDTAPVVAKAKPKPKRTPQQARTGSFSTTTAAVAPQPKRSHRTATAAGGFNVVDTPTVPARNTRRAVTTAGFAAGESDAPVKRNAPPRRTVSVSDTGFGTEVADAGSNDKRGGTVQQGGFGNSDAPAPTPRTRRRVEKDLDKPVEIVSKVKPLYTDQARDLRIEGEVVLEVTFDAGGTLTIHRVVDGLGHGLDEAAIKAAEKIKFEPARRDGKPVNHTAKLRVVFRLA